MNQAALDLSQKRETRRIDDHPKEDYQPDDYYEYEHHP
jgi:hypothetical protein